ETLGLDKLNLTQRTVFSENFGASATEGDAIVAKFNVADLSDPVDDDASTTTDTSSIYALKDGSGYAVLASDGKYYALDTDDAASLAYDSTAGETAAEDVDVKAGPVTSILASVALDTDTNLDGADITELNDAKGNGTGEFILNNGDGTYNLVTIGTDGVAE